MIGTHNPKDTLLNRDPWLYSQTRSNSFFIFPAIFTQFFPIVSIIMTDKCKSDLDENQFLKTCAIAFSVTGLVSSYLLSFCVCARRHRTAQVDNEEAHLLKNKNIKQVFCGSVCAGVSMMALSLISLIFALVHCKTD